MLANRDQKGSKGVEARDVRVSTLGVGLNVPKRAKEERKRRGENGRVARYIYL